MIDEISDEQRARIQRNRERALALRLEKQKQQLEADQSTCKTVQSDNSGNDGFTAIMKPSSTPPATNFGSSSTTRNLSSSAPSTFNKAGDYDRGSTSRRDNRTPHLRGKETGLSKYFDSKNSKADSNVSIADKPTATCVLTTNYRFTVVCPYNKEAIDVFRSIRGGSYKKKMKELTTVSFVPLPGHVIDIFGKYTSDSSPPKSKREFDLTCIEEALLSRLFPFQTECIHFAISNGGRVLIADDMGLGKTVEALGIMSYYRDDWPALIICPASLRYTWKKFILDWLPSVKEEEIAVIDSNKDFPSMTSASTTIAIISYSSALLKTDKHSVEIRNKFRFMVLDESHLIKSAEAQRTKACLRIAKSVKRIVLLTGTPALSRPQELFTQISAVRPSLFGCFTRFGQRYCDPKPLRTKGKNNITDYSGNSNMEELEVLLRETIMIRRVKEDVLSQLPDKVRGIVVLDGRLVKIDQKEAAFSRKKIQNDQLSRATRRSEMLKFFSSTATSKLGAVAEYVSDLLENRRKFLVFAHHQVMMDHLEKTIADKGHDVIRIDGSTPSAERQRLCDRFQTDDYVRVAILSITASGTGLTLTAANLVVFAELFWNPGVLAQAEDRAHRVGQSDCVHVQYLVAEGTVDDFIWVLIQKKLQILNKGGLSKGKFQTSETTRLGPQGAVDPQQLDITEFMESLSQETLTEDLFDASPSKRQRTR